MGTVPALSGGRGGDVSMEQCDKRPKLVINLPIDVLTVAAIVRACPPRAYAKSSDDGKAMLVYWDDEPVDDPKAELLELAEAVANQWGYLKLTVVELAKDILRRYGREGQA